jgi:SAM-dependent methyltransferase
MRLTDSTAIARAEYADAVSPVLGRDRAEVLAVMDRELAQLRSGVDSVSDRRWYLSLARGEPDYSIYDDPEYMLYLWPGTVMFARPTLRWTVNAVPPGEVDTVVDLGCGIGYTTAVLASCYPGADVFGTNVEGVQAQVARALGREHGFTLRADVSSISYEPRRTLVVASEYFEHFHRPVEHLCEVLNGLGCPRWLAIANAFGARSAGHFPEYADRGGRFPPRAIGTRFNGTLRRAGYRKAGSGWNGRPTLWER